MEKIHAIESDGRIITGIEVCSMRGLRQGGGCEYAGGDSHKSHVQGTQQVCWQLPLAWGYIQTGGCCVLVQLAHSSSSLYCLAT